MPHVDFDEPGEVEASDQTFTFQGRTWTLRSPLDIDSAVTTGWVTATAAVRAAEDEEARAEARGQLNTAVDALFREALMPDQGEDFVKAANDPKARITPRVIDGILRLMLEHALGGRPTKPASGSSRGRKRTARKSTAGSSSPGTTRAASTG